MTLSPGDRVRYAGMSLSEAWTVEEVDGDRVVLRRGSITVVGRTEDLELDTTPHFDVEVRRQALLELRATDAVRMACSALRIGLGYVATDRDPPVDAIAALSAGILIADRGGQ